MSRATHFDPADDGDWPVPKDCELLDGRVVEMATGAYKAWCSGQLLCALIRHCEAHDLGWVFPSSVGYRFFPGRCHLRRVSGSVIQRGRFADGRVPWGDARVAPDLAAHFVAPGESADYVHQKVLDFLTNGTRLFWLVFVESRTALVFRSGGTANFVREDATLDGENVVPGFGCRLGDLFEPGEPDPDQPVHVPASE